MVTHIFGPTADNTVNIRAYCPICKKKRYGRYIDYYDTAHVFLSCGFNLDLGYGQARGHYGPQGGHPLWRNVWRLKDWGWTIKAWRKKVPVPSW